VLRIERGVCKDLQSIGGGGAGVRSREKAHPLVFEGMGLEGLLGRMA